MQPLYKDEPALVQLIKVAMKLVIDFFGYFLISVLCAIFGGAVWLDYAGPGLFVAIGLYLMIGLPLFVWIKTKRQQNEVGRNRNDASTDLPDIEC